MHNVPPSRSVRARRMQSGRGGTNSYAVHSGTQPAGARNQLFGGGMNIQVLIAESNPFVRVGLETILTDAEGITVCGVFDDAEEALAACAELRPDVVLMDRPLACEVHLPTVRRHCDDPSGVLVFLDRLHEQEIFEMLSAGVAGFIAKRDDPEMLCQAIRAIADGDEVWLSPRVSQQLLPPRRRPSVRARLSQREQSILRAMASGRSNADIAGEHHISAGTVRNVVSAIYTKLGVKNRSAAVAWAWRNGVAATSEDPESTESASEDRGGEEVGYDPDANVPRREP